MKTEKQITLVNGTFSAEEAFEVLSNMLDNKIHFHHVKNFSEMERNGSVNENSVRRIEELKESIKHLDAIIKEARNQNKHLRLTSLVEISFTDEPQAKSTQTQKSADKQKKA